MFRILVLLLFFGCVILPISITIINKLQKTFDKENKNNITHDIYEAFKSLSNLDEKFIKRNEKHIRKLMQTWHSYSEDIFDKMKNIERLNNKIVDLNTKLQPSDEKQTIYVFYEQYKQTFDSSLKEMIQNNVSGKTISNFFDNYYMQFKDTLDKLESIKDAQDNSLLNENLEKLNQLKEIEKQTK